MTYCTQQDLVDRFGDEKLVQVTDLVNTPASTIDAVTVAKKIGDASSTIDSYIAKRVALPLGSVPAVLTKIAIDLSWYSLLGSSVGKDDPEAIAYRDAIRWLENVSKGLVVIIDETASEAPAAGHGQIQVNAPKRVFTRDSMSGY